MVTSILVLWLCLLFKLLIISIFSHFYLLNYDKLYISKTHGCILFISVRSLIACINDKVYALQFIKCVKNAQL